jgi:hypothetical protein
MRAMSENEEANAEKGLHGHAPAPAPRRQLDAEEPPT